MIRFTNVAYNFLNTYRFFKFNSCRRVKTYLEFSHQYPEVSLWWHPDLQQFGFPDETRILNSVQCMFYRDMRYFFLSFHKHLPG